MLSRRFQADVPGSMFVYPVRQGVSLPEAFVKHALVPQDPLALPAARSTRTATGGSQRGPTSSCADPAQRAARAATVAVPLAFLALFFAWPLVAILRRSLVVDGSLDLPFDVLTASSTREIAWFTFWQATVSTVLTLLAGTPACLGARAVLVPRALARRGPRARPVRPADDRRRDRVPRAPPGRGRAVGVGDPARPRLLQRRGRRARGRRVLGRSRRTALGRGGDARRRPCAATAAADGAAARAGAGVGRLDRVPLLLHLVRRDRRPRRNPLLHARDGDLQPGGALLRPAHGRGARPPPARRRRGGRDRLRGCSSGVSAARDVPAGRPRGRPAAAGSRSTGSS